MVDQAEIVAEYDVCSGMPNPVWTLSDADAAALIAYLPTGLSYVAPVYEAPSILGYRGTIIRASGDYADQLASLGLPTYFRILPDPVGGLSDLTAYFTAPSVSDAVPSLGKPGEDISYVEASSAQALAATCSLAYTSATNFDFWNGDRMGRNNCYNYAANYASNTDYPGADPRDGRALPGRISGRPLPSRATDAQFTNSMIADGWSTTCSGTSLKVFGVTGTYRYVSNGRLYEVWDFHFYRRNLNSSGSNRWCHKPGHTRATNRDHSGDYITSPTTADRSFYTNEVGYFYSPAGSRSVRVR